MSNGGIAWHAAGRRMTVTAASRWQRCMDGNEEEECLLVLRRVAETGAARD
jgi:hypothetical protein